MKARLQFIGVVGLNGFFLLASAYLVWGWITIADIRSKCEKKGYDFDLVMASLITGPAELDAALAILTGGTNSSVAVDRYPGLGRHAVHFMTFDSVERTTTRTNGMATDRLVAKGGFIGGLIEPFAFMSDNFVNWVFCMGIGYIMSSTLLLLKFLKNVPLSIRYLVLRPVAGALVGGCLFILVLSGGALFWSNVSHVSGLSIGVLAAFGAVYCERFESVLKKGFAQKAKSEE